MPHDETVEQHKANHAEETEEVEKDKNSADGLFKGSFPSRHGELWRDEEDGGVMRCPACGHEHEGGPTCQQCGAELDDVYGFSDMDDDVDLSDLDVGDYDENSELEVEIEEMRRRGGNNIVRNGQYVPAFFGDRRHQLFGHIHTHHHFPMDDTTDSEDPTNSDNSNQDNSEDEDAGSLEDFIAPDDDDSESVFHPRLVSVRVGSVRIVGDDDDDDDDDDDESEDEGGAITNRRRPRPGWTRSSATPSAPISISEDENGSSTNGSEFGDDDSHEARMRLRASGGWSPLDEGEDDDADGLVHNNYSYRGYPTTEDEEASDESDSETIGNPNSDNEADDDQPTEGFSADFQQFSHDYPSSMDGDDAPNDYGSESENPYDYDTDGEQSHNMDRDGDTEMSVSPRASRSSREVSVESQYGENLGVSNEMADVDDDSSDASIRPAPRRRPRHNPIVQQYNPRISMLFAEHQNTVRNSQNPVNDMNHWEDDSSSTARIEPASIRRRRQNPYSVPSTGYNGQNNHHRSMPPHHFDRARTPRGSPLPREIHISSRNNRLQRRYPA